MALVVFLRGVNVGGHRTFRPSALAKALSRYGVVNLGAAGTFVVRKPGARAKFRAELLRRLPFETQVTICDGAEILRLETDHPFAEKRADVVRFVTIFEKECGKEADIPCQFPANGAWLVRILEARGRFVFGEYRRHMKTITYLGQADKLFGASGTTRNWNTIQSLLRILKSGAKGE